MIAELQPEFTNTLENQTVYKTVTVIFECRLSKPNKTVQWVHNGQHIRLDDRISVTVAIYTHRLIIKGVKMEDVGTVQCVCGNVSTDCTLTVEGKLCQVFLIVCVFVVLFVCLCF